MELGFKCLLWFGKPELADPERDQSLKVTQNEEDLKIRQKTRDACGGRSDAAAQSRKSRTQNWRQVRMPEKQRSGKCELKLC